MTAKRFSLYEHKDNDYILDNPNVHLDFIEMLGDALTSEEIVDLLNQLNEENEQLKTFLEAFKEELSLANRDNDTLEKENELLRIKIRKLRLEKIHQNKENEHIKHTIKTMMENERTELGQSVLKQLWEQIE